MDLSSQSLVIDYGFFHIMLETDSLIVYNAWHNRKRSFLYLGAILSNCFSLFLSFLQTFSLVHVCRTDNLAADFMVKFSFSHSCNVWPEDCPQQLEAILHAD